MNIYNRVPQNEPNLKLTSDGAAFKTSQSFQANYM